MRKGKILSKIFGIALVFVMIGSMLGKVATWAGKVASPTLLFSLFLVVVLAVSSLFPGLPAGQAALVSASDQTELITNGGFESGSTGWGVHGDFYADSRFDHPHYGTGYAYLSNEDGTAGNNLGGTLDQTVSIPSSATSAMLTFWYSITTWETESYPYDGLDVIIFDTEYNWLATAASLDNTDSQWPIAYSQKSFDMTPYIGQTIVLVFEAATDGNLPTVFRIDDVSILATEPPPPPTLISPPNNSHQTSSITFQWDSVGATNCRLFLLLPGSSSWLYDETTLTSYPYSPTLMGEYYWKVKAYVNGEWSDYSEEWIFYFDGSPAPSLISPLNDSETTQLRPTFQWSSVSGTTCYELQLARDSSFTDMVRDNLSIHGISWQLDNQDLTPGQTYYWRVRCSIPIGHWSSVWHFTVSDANHPPYEPYSPSPWPSQPGVSIYTDLSWSGGDPDGDSVTYDVYFEKGDSSPDQLVSNDQTGTTYDPGTMDSASHYYWQIVAKDEHGATTPGDVWDFTTGTVTYPPEVTTNAATGIGTTSATLNGNLDSTGGLTCQVWFEYGTTTSYGSATSQISKSSAGAFDKYISGLTPGITYHFRACASNSKGTLYGLDRNFTTETATYPPEVTTNAATGIGTTSATLNGNLDSTGGLTCQVWFEYGTTTSYGSATSQISKSSAGAFDKYISGLTPGITYHFRACASNSKGTRYGLDRNFTTGEVPNQPPDCVIELREEGTASQIDKVYVGQFFDIYIGNSTDDTGITEVRFSSDDFQDDIPTGEWTGWYDWNTSSGDWNAETKIERWSFATPGIKEVWVEVRDDGSNAAQCHADIWVHPGYAIIVAGQADWRQKSAIDHSANNAYRVLRNLGFDDDHIFYLNDESQQIDGQNVVDKSASLDDLSNSLDEIKQEIGESPTPLILYLVGHGIKEVFDFYTESDPMSSTDLRGMLEPFQDNLMLIVIGSCYSGSFITIDFPTDTRSISGHNRIIITASHDDQKTGISVLGLGGWYHSSDRFWGNLNEGLNVKEAFIATGDRKHMWLDDNGDNIGHPHDNLGNDGALASATTIGVAGTDDLELTSWYSVWIHSAGELRVYDSQNRVTGMINGEVKEEIPDSIYDEENEIVAIFSPSDTYRYKVVGTDEGTYGLDIGSVEGANTTAVAAVDVPTSTNATHNYTINWTALSQGEAGVTIQIDSDGDGEFEQTINTTPPDVPSSPSPSDNATNISLSTVLGWTGGDPDGDNVTYKVYFGSDHDPPLVSENQTETSYSPSLLNYGTKYYWRVVARDEHGLADGSPVWQFTTELGSEWGKVGTPYRQDWTIAPNSDILVPASIPGGEVIYVVGYGHEDNNLDNDYGPRLWKSEDSGVTWDDLADKVWDADDLPVNFSSSTSYFNYVACAFDDSDFVAVAVVDSSAAVSSYDYCNMTQAVVISDDGGDNFYWMGDVIDSSANATLNCVFDMAISDEDNDGKRSVAIGGVGTKNGTCSTGLVYRYQTGGLTGSHWVDASAYDGWDDDGAIASQAVTMVAFAPSWLDDRTVLAVSHTATATYLQSGTWGNTTAWNEPAGFEPTVLIVDDPSIWSVFKGAAAGLALPPDYEGRHANTRYVWVYVDRTDGSGVIYRVVNGAVVEVAQQISGNPYLASLSYLGAIDEGKAIAGLLGDGTGYPTECCEGVQVYRNDGITDMDICCERWSDACKPPTGTMAALVGYVSPNKAYAFVGGTGTSFEEGAFSFSLDDGDTWNQMGLVDTYVTYLSDVAKSANCNKTWVVSVNTEQGGVCECDSVWLKANPLPEAPEYSGAWIREWCEELTSSTGLNGADTPEIGLLRLAPEETEEALTVYLVDRGTDTVYYDDNKGLGCWEQGSSTVDEISDLAVQDEATIYAVGYDGKVAVSDDHGCAASWGSTMDSKVDTGHTIAVHGEGNVLVGGADGKVAYSDSDLATFLDGDASFAELDDIGDGNVHVAFDSYFDTNGVVYAAVSNVHVNTADNGIYRWVIGESSRWKDLGECTGTATPSETQLGLGPSCDRVEVGYYGIILSNADGNPETDATTGGVLYATFHDAANNVTGVARCLNPAEEVACGGADWDYLVEDINEYHGAFMLEPSSLKICGCLTPDTNSKLWAIDDSYYYDYFATGDEDSSVGRLWTYRDCHAKSAPVLVAPADRAVVPCDLNHWWNDAFALKWDRQCDARSYNLQIAYDDEFTGLVLDISGKYANCTEIDYQPPSGSNLSYAVENGALGPGSCGTMFYWRVRSADAGTGEIIHSPWSEARSFTVAGGAEHYNLTINSTSGGNVTVPGEGTFGPYNASKVVDLVAAADANYTFVNWTGDTETIGNENSPTTIIIMNGDYSIIANFKELPPGIYPDPSSLHFTANVGAANPPSQTLDICNGGGGILNWTANIAGANATWLSMSPMSGGNLGAAECNSTEVAVNITGLTQGTYHANITINAPGANNTPQVVPVSLHISEPPPSVPVWSTGDNWVYNCSYENPEGAPKYEESELTVAVVGEVVAGEEEGINEVSYKLSGIFVPLATRDAAYTPLMLHVETADIWNSKDHMEYVKQSSAIAELPGLLSTITWNYTGDYGWPYDIGKTWNFTKHTVAGPLDETVDREAKVLGVEAVTVPAGTFECYHIVTYDPASPGNYTFEHWFNATVKTDVKMIDRDTWAGEETKVLTSYSVQYNLTVNSTSGGNVTTPGEGTFACYAGEVVDLVATADGGYQFVSWTGDVGTIADVDSAATNLVMTGNYSITANFGAKGAEVDSEWDKVDTPNMTDWTVAPGSDVYMPALGIDGQRVYVIGTMWEDENGDGWINYTEETARLWKSEDGGATWDDITKNVMKEIRDEVAEFNETTPWTDMVAWFNFVTVPLDDSNFVALGVYLGNILDPANWQQVVLVSDDGGGTFYLLHYPIQDTLAGTSLTDIFGMNVGLDVDGRRNIAVAGIEDPDRSIVWGYASGDEKGRIYRYRTGGLVGQWEDATTGKPDWISCTAVTWVYFSGMFADDHTIVAVTHNATTGGAPNDDSYFQTGTWSGDNVNWNEAASRGEAALLTTAPTAWWLLKGSTSGISLPLDYDGRDKNMRCNWVTLNTAEGVTETAVGTIYRVVNGNAEPITQQVEGQPWLAGIFYFGTIDHGKAVAGLIGNGHVTKVITDPTAGLQLMTCGCDGVQVYRNDGIADMDICCQAWQPACKPPTGHGAAMAIIAPPGGTKIYCVTAGLMMGMRPNFWPSDWFKNMHIIDKYDESAFSVSFDGGDTFNQLGLIDTDMDYLTDVAQSPDCNTTYLASINLNLPGERNEHWDFLDPLVSCYPCGECDSVFFKSKNLAEAIPFAQGYDDTWFRVGTRMLTSNPLLNGADTPQIGLIRLAPEETEEINTVYFADRGSDTVYYDGNKGLGCWETGSSTVSEISDLAVQDEASIYALGKDASVAVSDDHGFGASWSNTMDSKVDEGHTIAVHGEGNVLVGGADGKVAYSDDNLSTFLNGAASFTELDDIGEGRVHVAFDSYFDSNSVVYAAVSYVDTACGYGIPVNDADNGIYRWVIGESSNWTDLGECAGTATPTETQLGLGPSCNKVEVGYYGIVLSTAEGNPETDATTGGVLYATFYDADGNVTGVARCLNPAEEVAYGGADWDYLIEDVNEYHGAFTLEPSSLKICGCLTPDTNSKLWAIDDALYYNGIVVEEDPRYDSTLGRLWSYEDCYAKAAPTLLSPADSTVVDADPYYCWNDAFILKWDRQCDACSYNLQIAYDEDFTGLLLDWSGKDADCQEIDYAPPSGSNPSYLVAEGALGPHSCGITFYWRVRSADAETGEIIHSWWSETRSFTVAGETEHYNLTINSTAGGNVTTPGEDTFTYNAGEVVDLVATADSGYQLVNWTGDTETIANENSPTTIIIMTGNYSIIANFKELPPEICPNPSSLHFTANVGGANPPSQTLDICNAGGYILNWMANITDANVTWLSMSPTYGGNLSAADCNSTQVAVNITGLTQGTYHATINITGSSSVEVPVTLNVGLPAISVSPASLNFTANVEETPPDQTLEVCNSGSGTLSWSLSDNAGWLSETPTSGSLGEAECEDVTVSVDVTGMEAGDYSATITITGSAQVQVAVNLYINVPPPGISFSPSSLSFSAVEGGSNLTNETLEIWNSGGGTLNWTLSDDAAWLSEMPENGTSSGEHDNVTVSVNITGMSAEDYSANITISAAGANNTPQVVPVSLHISPGVTVTVDAPAGVKTGDYFTATVDISSVTDFDAAGFRVVFDSAVLAIDNITPGADITNGLIDGTTIPVVQTNQTAAGTVKVVVNVPGTPGVTGSGYLCQIRFHALGTAGTSSTINLGNGSMSDKIGNPISAAWVGDSINLLEHALGDANGDGVLNAQDLTKVERMVVGLDPTTPEADLNQDGVYNAQDITLMEILLVS